MTRLEAAAFVGALDVALADFDADVAQSVVGAIDDFAFARIYDTDTVSDAMRERLISLLADEEPTSPLPRPLEDR